MKAAKARTIALILGDQLSHDISSLQGFDPREDVVLMVEVADEATYVRHHKQKIAFILSAMRHFADELRERGFRVDYVRLDDKGNSNSFTGELIRAVARHKPDCVVVTEPGEWRVRKIIAFFALWVSFEYGRMAARLIAWSISIGKCAVEPTY